jgi:hypothetical protein
VIWSIFIWKRLWYFVSVWKFWLFLFLWAAAFHDLFSIHIIQSSYFAKFLVFFFLQPCTCIYFSYAAMFLSLLVCFYDWLLKRAILIVTAPFHYWWRKCEILTLLSLFTTAVPAMFMMSGAFVGLWDRPFHCMFVEMPHVILSRKVLVLSRNICSPMNQPVSLAALTSACCCICSYILSHVYWSVLLGGWCSMDVDFLLRYAW